MSNICLLLTSLLQLASAQVPYTPVPRWGQATALLNNIIYVQGGKTDPTNSYGYSSAPTDNSLLSLSLTSPFDNSSVPWQLLSSESNSSTSQGPLVAWHTISAFNTSDLLIFGGEVDPNSTPPTQTGANSAWILDVANQNIPQFISETESWGSEPIRRFHHTAVTALTGKVYIIGGEKADGSNTVFSQHVVFDPSGPSFTQLPSENGPQEITRHGSVILPNGLLLVFGGYSTTISSLVSFSTIWTLDITQQTPSWSTLNVSTVSLPLPRRDFAYTLLSGNRVLIHGGIDGDVSDHYDTVYSDGWILDVSQTPAIWAQIDSLSQLGQRFDHFAVAYGSIVIFGFGYQSSSPAPALVQIYNSTGNGSWSSSFTPPGPSQSPTQTIPSSSSTLSYGQSSSSPITSLSPTQTTGGGGGGNSDNLSAHKTTGLAIGISLGILAILGICALLFIIMRKRRREQTFRRSFMALQGDHEGDSPQSIIPTRAHYDEKGHDWIASLKNWSIPAIFGLSSNIRRSRQRKDMLADEDTRYFGTPYTGKGSRQSSSWSLRSVLGRRSREPSSYSISSRPRWADKDPFSDGAAVTSDDETGFVGAAVPGAARPMARREYSHSSTISGRSYFDPFADPIQEEPREYHDAELSDDSPSHPNLHIQTLLPLPIEPHVLSPVTEMSRNTSSFGTTPSVSSYTDSQEQKLTPFENSSGLTSGTSYNSRSPRPSSILDSTPGSSQNVRRSDSWWARFAKTSFLDRGNDSRVNRPLEIRDPNPPPRLMAIEENQHSASSDEKDSPDSHRSNSLKRGLSTLMRNKPGGAHTKSSSSLRTADSEAIEKMAGMDVAQHERSGSNRTRGSTGTSMESRSEDSHWLPHDSETEDIEDHILTSPVETIPVQGYQDHPLALTKSEPPTQTPPGTWSATSLSSDRSDRRGVEFSSPGVSAVSARVKEYERRLSQDVEVLSPTNTKYREEKSRKFGHVGYGLVPRQNLFVANPDHRHASSSSTDA